jgi:hypothetical protein
MRGRLRAPDPGSFTSRSDDGVGSEGDVMDLDHFFRMVLIAGVLLVLPVGSPRQAQASREPLDRRQEGLSSW